MRASAIAALLVGGCTFTPGGVPDQPDAGYAPGPGSGDADPPDALTCRVSDTATRLCIEFDDGMFSPMVHDASSGRHDATATNVSQWNRGGDGAAAVSYGSSIHVPENADLDIGDRITIDMWVMPFSLTVFGKASSTLLANRGQYELMIDSAGYIQCSLAGVTARTAFPLQPNTWSHVACTYDGEVAALYINGDEADCPFSGSAIATNGTTGTSIATDQFTGAIDDIHVFARAFSSVEVCQLANRTTCDASCSSDNFGEGQSG